MPVHKTKSLVQKNKNGISSAATLKTMSEHLGVSVTQVSRALNGHSDVSLATKTRVLEAAKYLNYQPNVAARRLVSGSSGIVGLVYPYTPEEADAWYFTQFIASLSHEFLELDMQLMTHMAQKKNMGIEIYQRLIATDLIDGFIVLIPAASDPRVDLLKRMGVPFALHGRIIEREDYAFLDVDNEAIGYDLTQHLISKGHTDIAFINGRKNECFVERRSVGYQRAIVDAGLSVNPRYQAYGPMGEEFGLLESIRLFQNKPRPTAIIAGNTLIAKGVLKAAQISGLNVPRDLSLVAHDDLLPAAPAHLLSTPLTVTYSPLINCCEKLASLMRQVLNGSSGNELQLFEPYTLVERASVAKLN